MEEEKNKRKITRPLFVFFFESLLYLLTMGLGVLGGLRLNKYFEVNKISAPNLDFLGFILYFVVGISLLLVFLYLFKNKKKKKKIFKGFFVLIVVLANIFFLGLWFPSWLVLIILGVLLFFSLKKKFLWSYNLLVIFALAGAGADIGVSLEPRIVILLLLVFSIYDYIAVYKTKHMVKMAKEMIESNAVLGIIIPQNFKQLNNKVSEIEIGGKFMVLGGGDIVFPLVFTVAVSSISISSAIIVALFSYLGMVSTFLIFFFQEKRTPMPALPPIALFSIIGYLIAVV